ncbi:MAG: glycosyltransferase family 39 protein, partial [Chloroflexi bacterium]|nr:glycosyltransferase family 39 protein [Chloroflexota bacterium]
MNRLDWRAHPLLAAILAAFVLLAGAYSVITPIFEAGDEVWHYPVVENIARGRGLPVQDPATRTLWEQEGGQPPLYYALGAALTFWIDTRDLAERRWINPHAIIGIPLLSGNKNLVVHTSAENFPWQGTTLAVHLIRFFSIFLSAISVALTYFLALEIGKGSSPAALGGTVGSTAALPPKGKSLNSTFPFTEFTLSEANPSAKQSPSFKGIASLPLVARNDVETRTLAAFAAAFVAFNPMFLFISASVNNDALAVMLATLAMLLLARLITRGATIRQFIILGIVL